MIFFFHYCPTYSFLQQELETFAGFSEYAVYFVLKLHMLRP